MKTDTSFYRTNNLGIF